MKIPLLAFMFFLSSVDGKAYPSLNQTNKNTSSNVKITYLTRSGWLAETENHLLLFDYVPYEGKNYDAFVQLEFDNAIKNKKQLFIFISHEHEDHFYSKLLDWGKKYSNLEIVLGWNYKSSQTGIHQLIGREEKMIKQVNIAVHPSTDAGSAFLVTVEGITLYHAGDHAQWAPGLKEDFTKETKYIKEKVSKIDVAFIPVESRRNLVMDGAIAATRILNSEHVLPMHSKFEDYKLFADRVKSLLPSVQIYFPKANKEVFTIHKQ
jgi:L-ascorbate metabolism protein UlaG (beta-lactamase superfamily)